MTVSRVAAPRWEVVMTFSNLHSGSSGSRGSFSQTSRAAPQISPVRRASTRAASSMTAPRASLTMMAFFFIFLNCSAPIMPRVSLVSGQCRETTSERSSRVSRSTYSQWSSCSFSMGMR